LKINNFKKINLQNKKLIIPLQRPYEYQKVLITFFYNKKIIYLFIGNKNVNQSGDTSKAKGIVRIHVDARLWLRITPSINVFIFS
jgi:hypothetical protein